jgi:hypothetical protein
MCEFCGEALSFNSTCMIVNEMGLVSDPSVDSAIRNRVQMGPAVL